MAFHDVKLPDNVERGAQGGPQFKTTILTMSSGFEKRNISWERTRGEWDISYGIGTKEDQEKVLAFFYARRGRAHSFRFKDWTDYQIGRSNPQFLEVADGVKTKFQIFRLYENGAFNYVRPITRPVSSTVEVFLDGALQTTGVSVSSLGVITFSSAPTNGLQVRVRCEFDVPVRFDVDKLNLSATFSGNYAIPSIDIVEVREKLEVI